MKPFARIPASLICASLLALLLGSATLGSVFVSEMPSSFRGKVLLPDGQPAADVPVVVWSWRTVFAKTRTDTDGVFNLNVNVQHVGKEVGDDWKRIVLVSAQRGYGPGFQAIGRVKDPQDITLRLAEDEPVSGRILDQQGRPIPNAKVAIDRIFGPRNAELDGFLEVSRDQPTQVRRFLNDEMKSLNAEALSELRDANDEAHSQTETNKDGEFVLNGFGRERVLLATVEGHGIMTDSFYIVTRRSIDEKWKRGQLSQETREAMGRGSTMPLVYPANFEYFGAPSATIRGTIVDADTGSPLSGVGIYAHIPGVASFVRASTDAQGRYELSGLPLEGRVTVRTSAEDQQYVGAEQIAKVSATRPGEVLDFKLDRGIRVHGQLLNKNTGEPVPGGVGYVAWSGNPQLANLHHSYPFGHTTYPTAEDGSYSLIVPAGSGVIWAVGRNRDEFEQATTDGISIPLREDGLLPSINYGFVDLSQFNAVEQVEPTLEDEVLQLDIELRPKSSAEASSADKE